MQGCWSSILDLEPLIPNEPITVLHGMAFEKEVVSKLDFLPEVFGERAYQHEGKTFYFRYHATFDDARVSGLRLPELMYALSSYFPAVVRADLTLERFDEGVVDEILNHFNES